MIKYILLTLALFLIACDEGDGRLEIMEQGVWWVAYCDKKELVTYIKIDRGISVMLKQDGTPVRCEEY